MMRIVSPAFSQNGLIPVRYTCDGEDQSPPLEFFDVPTSTQSLVLIVEDPDVPPRARVRVWDHWVVFNIPPEVRVITEGEAPSGIVGRETGGEEAYRGPCPPDREHRYFFKLLALDMVLGLPRGATKEMVLAQAEGHILATAELVGRYHREK